MKNSLSFFLQALAWSLVVLEGVFIALELWRPGFVDYLIPVWVPLIGGGIAGLFSLVVKR